MSKNKGNKNNKKTPAQNTAGKGKTQSAYKSESESDQNKQQALEAFTPKTGVKEGGNHKS